MENIKEGASMEEPTSVGSFNSLSLALKFSSVHWEIGEINLKELRS
jgi:hypothetical protein